MMLASLLSPDRILPDLHASERLQAITEIVDHLVACSALKQEDRKAVLDALREREESMSTGIGFGIAIPHASSDRVNDVVAAFARSQSGIEFDSLDNELVHFIVLFVVPVDQFQTHLRTLAAIAKFLNDRSVREQLACATDPHAIMEIFTHHSARIRE